MKKAEKQVSTKKLVKIALKKKQKWTLAAGYVHLARIKTGEMFKLENGTEGIHIKSNECRSVVVIISSPIANTEEDKRYYLGKQNWSPNTEVRRM